MRLLVSAMEPSANLHLKSVLEHIGEVELIGLFDRSLGNPLYGSDEFSVMGFVDALGKLLKAKEAIRELTFLAGDADKVLLIDGAAFNIPLAKAIKKRFPKKEIIYYILPKAWAWKPGRAKKVERYCDTLASIFPFEHQFYPSAVYVGNPLLDQISVRHDPQQHYNTIAFLAGSRKSEITRLMPVFKETAKALESKKVLVIPPHFSAHDIEALYGDLSDFEINCDTHQALAQSDFAFICSGTATLEAALIGTPFVLVYKAKKIDEWIARRFVKLKHAGLANILMDFEGLKPVHPELLQEEVTAVNLLLYEQKLDRGHFWQKSQMLNELLRHGSAERVAKLLKP